jgi:hypothetical protein
MITSAETERDLVDELQTARVELRRVIITQMLGGWTAAGRAMPTELEADACAEVRRAHESLRRWRRTQAGGAEDVARLPVRRRTKEFRP